MGTLLPLATQTPGWGSQTASTDPTLSFTIYVLEEKWSSKLDNPSTSFVSPPVWQNTVHTSPLSHDVYILLPGTCDYATLCGKNDFTDMINLKDIEIKDLTKLSK